LTEKQFNPDLEKLSQLATQTKGVVYFPNQVDAQLSPLRMIIIKQLKKPDNTISVDRLALLLILIVSLLSTEWFVRKYNGLCKFYSV
jgi:hypothetical protein